MENLKNLVNVKLLENLRIKNGYSINKLCALSKVSYKTYQNIINEKNYGVVALFKLAKCLNTTVLELFK